MCKVTFVMPFDLPKLEAEIALRITPTDRLPAIAADALEAGFDGPGIVEMAILDSRYLWAIDRALPAMMHDLGLTGISPREAALRLATRRAQDILSAGEDPMRSADYFYRLWIQSDCLDQLSDIGNLDDISAWTGQEKLRSAAEEILREFLSKHPESS